MPPISEWNFAGRLAERLGPRSCIIDAATGSTIDGERLPRLIAAYGNSLLSAGLEAGDRVLIGCTLSPASALVYLGAIYAGLVAVPVDERTLVTSALLLVEATGAKALWNETGLDAEASCALPAICLQGDLAGETSDVMPPAACAASDLAALMATSGSTGIPRFVLVSHENLIANTEAIIPSQGLGSDERALLILPVSYCFGASVMHTHLYQGGSVVFDRRFMFPNKVLQTIAQYGCTTFAGVPTVYNVLLRRSDIRKHSPANFAALSSGGGRFGPRESQRDARAIPACQVLRDVRTDRSDRSHLLHGSRSIA